MPPKFRPPDSYNFPGSSRNTPLQGEQIHDQNIGSDQVLNDVDMDGYNVTDTNQEDEIHRLIHDTLLQWVRTTALMIVIMTLMLIL